MKTWTLYMTWQTVCTFLADPQKDILAEQQFVYRPFIVCAFVCVIWVAQAWFLELPASSGIQVKKYQYDNEVSVLHRYGFPYRYTTLLWCRQAEYFFLCYSSSARDPCAAGIPPLSSFKVWKAVGQSNSLTSVHKFASVFKGLPILELVTKTEPLLRSECIWRIN